MHAVERALHRQLLARRRVLGALGAAVLGVAEALAVAAPAVARAVALARLERAVEAAEARLAPAGAVDARPASLRRIWPSSNNIMISYDCTSSKKLNFSHFF